MDSVQLDDLTIDVVQTRLQSFGNFIPFEILREVLEDAWSMDPAPDHTLELEQKIEILTRACNDMRGENEGLVRHINMLNAELAKAENVGELHEEIRRLQQTVERVQQGIPRIREEANNESGEE